MLPGDGPLTRRTVLTGLGGAVSGVLGGSSLLPRAEVRQSTMDARAEVSQSAMDLNVRVGTEGTVENTDERHERDIRVPTDVESVQAALDAAESGDTISVDAGHYEGGLTIGTPDVRLQAATANTPIIDATGKGTGVTIEASGVTIDGFEIVGDARTSSGISISTSAGATSDITIRNNHIHGMCAAGGGGRLQVSSWGIFSWGDEPLSGVHITNNHLDDIGAQSGEQRVEVSQLRQLSQLITPSGVGIHLEEISNSTHGPGAVIRGNRLTNIRDGSAATVSFPGIGIALLSLDGVNTLADASALHVSANEFGDISTDVVLGAANLPQAYVDARDRVARETAGQ